MSMKQWLKKWLGIVDKEPIKPDLPTLDLPYILANRHYLKSINPEDADEYLSKLTENERREYEADAALIWNNSVFQKELKHLFALQALFVANECVNWDQSLIGRGNVNGIGLIEDRFKLLHGRHLDNIKLPNDGVDN